MTATAVGFAGGRPKNPTYRDVCLTNTGHAEVVRVEYDPKRVSYGHLLEVFFAIHNPLQRGGQGVNIGDQYRSVVFYHGDSQRELAQKAMEALSAKLGKPLATRLVAEAPFYMAEDYHQQYYVKTGVAACPIPVKSGGGGS